MIRGERVNLRAVERADAEDLFRWFNDPELMRFWGVPDATVSLNEVQRRIEGWLGEEARLGRPACLIVETLGAESIGLVVLSDYRPDHRSVALSLMIGERARWGEGFGGDVLSTIVATCFDAWNLHRVWLRTEAFNDRAQRLYRRCGFTHEATLREATYLDGVYHDVLVFALLDETRAESE
jgi:RimJ/RimL family protein N-acetyltransferase